MRKKTYSSQESHEAEYYHLHCRDEETEPSHVTVGAKLQAWAFLILRFEL